MLVNLKILIAAKPRNITFWNKILFGIEKVLGSMKHPGSPFS